MSHLSKLFSYRYQPSPFPRLRDSEADTAPVGSLEAKAAILRVQEMKSKPTPPADRIPRVIPSQRR